ncbi:MAG: CRISPR-associated protein Cas4, partial [Prosthecobacter sp.]
MMNLPAYHTARALFPQGIDPRELGFLYEPLPVPADHPELDLFGIRRVQAANEAEDRETERSRAHVMNPAGGDGDGAAAEARAPQGRAAAQQAEEPMRARMLNEFVYCPRLFYYEQVEGVFVHNADTERGAAIHEKVDRGKGALPRARKKKAALAAGAAALDGEGQGEASADAAAAAATEHLTEGGEPDLADLKTHEPEPDAAAASDDQAEPRETIHSRSAMLSSERLGVVAKMDLIEVKMSGGSGARGGRMSAAAAAMPDLFAAREVQSVTPVDYKAGAPRLGQDTNELWDADKMQLGLQILILRDNGYVCDEGVIYYRATKQRVPLRMTAEIEAWIIDRIAAARRLAASPTIPPPLVNSPKCVRCSLAPVCLPDETRMLVGTAPAGRAATVATVPLTNAPAGRPPVALGPPRRLIAARDDERALYLNTQGCRVGLKSERLIIKDGD